MEAYIMKNQKQLRFGITTGTCAAAAARAAALHLLLRQSADKGNDVIEICTPGGMVVNVPVSEVSVSEKSCQYMVVKDSGDDPDVTDGAEIFAAVERIDASCMRERPVFHSEHFNNLYLDGGKGIGRVMKEGLEQSIGQAAINTVPREMIFQAVGEVCLLAEYSSPLLITISIPAGVELAERTFNPRLGIEDGISVLGTSGIIEPMSEKAIVDTIELEIKQLAKQGVKHLLVTPGNYGQAYASQYLGLNMEQSVKCSNYIGETIDLAVSYGMEHFLLVGNIGKLAKLAAGIMNTHSRVADGRCEIFAVHTILCGGTGEMAQTLMNCVNTDEMLKYLVEWNLKEAVVGSICNKIEEHMKYRIGDKMQSAVVLFSEKLGFLGGTGNFSQLVNELKEEMLSKKARGKCKK